MTINEAAERGVCTEDGHPQGGGKVPGWWYGSGWAWVPCAGCPRCVSPEESATDPDDLSTARGTDR